MIPQLDVPAATDADGTLSPELLRELVADLAATPDLWRGRVRHGDEREFELLWQDERVEVWLICWNGERHDTGFHDHDISGGAFAVAQGELVEERLTLGATLRRHLAEGDSAGFSPSHVHRVRGVGDTAAVSIHAYSPPLRRLGVYGVGDDGALERESVDASHELHADD